ncbi:MAG: monodechloroaminopyrrolnitrin synthase PrnB family protein [Pseudomonadota bacterium]
MQPNALRETRTTPNTKAFDRWIRGRFVELNTELEGLYATRENRADVSGIGEAQKKALLEEGRALIIPLLNEGNTDGGFECAFDLLGNVGFYMAACRRHGMTDPDRERVSPLTEASALAMHLGASLGVTPRYATSHLATHNRAINGRYKSFTALDDEFVFLEYNTRAVFSYQRAADALVKILPMGISHPLALDLLEAAEIALKAVARSNQLLFEKLDVDQFFYAVRPYYKPFRVGLHVYRGANAGDFAGINEIDLLLGLCQANDPSYSQQLVDKFLYMMPEDQKRLRNCMRQTSLLDDFLGQLDDHNREPWFQTNGRAFLDVCKAHGETAVQHHDQLVSRFIDQPAARLPEENHQGLTASGPPLPVLLRGLEKLRDLRCAAPRDDIPSRHGDLKRLRHALPAA